MEKQNTNNKHELEHLFYTKSIAVAGVSADFSKWNAGREFVLSLLESGYKGDIYPIGYEGGEIAGLRIYTSIIQVPDNIEYVIVAIPVKYLLKFVQECSTKGVRTVQIFTAGFGEIEDKEGYYAQIRLIAAAQKAGIRIIGPNCMGLYCPKTGLSFGRLVPTRSGAVGLISQSGGNSMYAIQEGATRGIYFSKVISCGNASDLNETDFLDYLIHDDETKIIALYLEGVKNGPRFFKVLKEAAKLKPVIVCKGGITEEGSRAVISHTASMAGSYAVWSSLLKQAHAIQVNTVEELLDVVSLFLYTDTFTKGNIAILGVGGGYSVQAADACSNAGLSIPLLPKETRRKLRELYGSEVGASFRNPIDIYWAKPSVFENAVKLVANCGKVNLMILHVSFYFPILDNEMREDPDFNSRKKDQQRQIESIVALSKEISKCSIIVLQSLSSIKSKVEALDAQRVLNEAGFPVFSSFRQAARAINMFVRYHQKPKSSLYQ